MEDTHLQIVQKLVEQLKFYVFQAGVHMQNAIHGVHTVILYLYTKCDIMNFKDSVWSTYSSKSKSHRFWIWFAEFLRPACWGIPGNQIIVPKSMLRSAQNLYRSPSHLHCLMLLSNLLKSWCYSSHTAGLKWKVEVQKLCIYRHIQQIVKRRSGEDVLHLVVVMWDSWEMTI